MTTLLVGDVGGTNTRLQVYQITERVKHQRGTRAPGKLLYEQKYKNENFKTFQDVVLKFLSESKTTPFTACFAVAGPVDCNRVAFTNRSAWIIDGEELQTALKIPNVKLINDFVAAGYGLLTLSSGDIHTLQDVPAKAGFPIACIGAGTGLGECFLTPDVEGNYTCFSSEGGHAEFAPRNDLEIELLKFLKVKFNAKHRISVERVVSGIGLANIYEFLSQKFPEKVDKAVHEKYLSAGDNQGGVVSESAPICELCAMAVDIMFSSYGSEAGVAALKWMPFSGLYIAGGIAPKNLERLKSQVFLGSYYDKGRVSAFLKQIPIHVVLDEHLGQRGAHLVAYQTLVGKGADTDSPGPICMPSEDAKYIVREIKKELHEKRIEHSWRDNLGNAAMAVVIGMAWFAGMKIINRVSRS